MGAPPLSRNAGRDKLRQLQVRIAEKTASVINLLDPILPTAPSREAFWPSRGKYRRNGSIREKAGSRRGFVRSGCHASNARAVTRDALTPSATVCHHLGPALTLHADPHNSQ